MDKGLNIFLSIIAVIIYVIVVAALAFVIFIAFSKARFMKKRSDVAKRAIFLIFISFIGLIIRLVCVLMALEGTNITFVDFLNKSLKTMYETFGVFSFDGQDFDFTLPWSLVFSMTTVWVAVTYFVIVAAGFNYGLQSWFALRIFKITAFFRFKTHKNIFIFGDVNKEAINLADSIRDKYYKSGEKYLIVFLVDETDSFDRKNKLHKKVRSQGYLFLTKSKSGNENEQKSVVNSLFHFIYNNYRFNIFALRSDDRGLGKSLDNCEAIVSDINYLFRDNLKISKKNVGFYYHVYVENEIEVHFVNNVVSNTINGFFATPQGGNTSKKLGKDIESLKKEYYELLSVEVFSYPSLCEISLEKSRRPYEIAKIVETKHINYEHDNIHRVFVFGFDPVAQASLRAIYAYSAGLDKDDKPYKFEAHVFDQNIDEISDIYERKHPMMIFHHVDFDNNRNNIHEKDILSRYDNNLDAIDGIGIPNIYFHKKSYKVVNFASILKEFNISLNGIDTVIIALGSDELNTEVANLVKMELDSNDEYFEDKHSIDIFVHNKSDNDFLSNKDTEKPSDVNYRIHLIPFGSYNECFIFDNLINSENTARTGFINELRNEYKGGVDITGKINTYKNKIKEIENNNRNNILYSNITRTDSLNHTIEFYSMIKDFIDKNKDNEELKRHISRLSHQFWARYKIVNGFAYQNDIDNESLNDKFDENIYSSRRAYTRDYKKKLETLVYYDELTRASTIKHIEALVIILFEADKEFFLE